MIFFPPFSYIWQTTVPEAIKEFVTNEKNKKSNKLIPSACSFGWLLPVSRTAKNSPYVRDTYSSYLLRIMVLYTKARF